IYQLDCVRWAKAVEAAGADAISAADSIGPAIDIDIETGEPVLGGPRGYGGLTGAAIKPLVLKMVLDISEAVKIPVIGIGGITKAEDAIAYIMAGATAVELATASTLYGYERYEEIVDGIEAFMKRKGYNSLEDFRGLTHKKIAERFASGKQIIQKIVLPVHDKTKCDGCGSCYMACAYGAIEMGERYAELIPDKCEGCGLCASVCAKKAITQNYFE
ncbi:MAG: 4Fe-4S binding protein, partial [Eubacteriales bacterium]|nr:4Fe-4S binding protein [Eubacteriales bacterium]